MAGDQMPGAGEPAEDRRILVLELRAARRSAREAATAEAVALLGDLEAEAARGGPLSERSGIVWVTIPTDRVQPARERLGRLGYARAVDLVVPDEEAGAWPVDMAERSVRWRHRPYRLVRLYQEDPDELRARAPDRREFLLETGGREVRAIRGYRGSGGALSHRSLPVPDARLLVNLAARRPAGVLLDPFAGAGGIVIEALGAGWRVISADVDPAVRHGLAHQGAAHVVADARRLPLADASVDAVATEPPYDRGAGELVTEALAELRRVLRVGGRIAMLCASWQAPSLLRASTILGLDTDLDTPINRKGLEVVVVVFRMARAR
jgi:SAM-dependent methyltransferase